MRAQRDLLLKKKNEERQ
jgi:hypothetical protein